jgi:hypothetical protein
VKHSDFGLILTFLLALYENVFVVAYGKDTDLHAFDKEKNFNESTDDLLRSKCACEIIR